VGGPPRARVGEFSSPAFRRSSRPFEFSGENGDDDDDFKEERTDSRASRDSNLAGSPPRTLPMSK